MYSRMDMYRFWGRQYILPLSAMSPKRILGRKFARIVDLEGELVREGDTELLEGDNGRLHPGTVGADTQRTVSGESHLIGTENSFLVMVGSS